MTEKRFSEQGFKTGVDPEGRPGRPSSREAGLFLEFAIAFLIGNFGGLPCFAKHESTLIGIDLPECVCNARERSGAQRLIVKLTGIG